MICEKLDKVEAVTRLVENPIMSLRTAYNPQPRVLLDILLHLKYNLYVYIHL